MSEIKPKRVVPCSEIAKECITEVSEGKFEMNHEKLLSLLPEDAYIAFLDFIEGCAPEDYEKSILYRMIKKGEAVINCQDEDPPAEKPE